MLERICQYSTIIFAGNVTVLLIVAITTDYWEHRGFDRKEIVNRIGSTNRTQVVFPPDTDSYFMIRYNRITRGNVHPEPADILRGNETVYQPPAIVHKHFAWHFENITVVNATNSTPAEYEIRRVKIPTHDAIVLFEQYGNLFRDCDDLEVGVRIRLGVAAQWPHRCFSFFSSSWSRDYVHIELPEVIHLERSAFTFAIACMLSFCVSLVGGAYGSLARDRCSMITGSFAAMISGITLTVAIALFHGKCHLLHRREFMAGRDIPFKKIIDEARTYSYGWSFVLAWICVVLCFVGSYVWLYQAQDIIVHRPRRMRYGKYYAYRNTDKTVLTIR